MSYPEHEKVKGVKDISQAIGEFLDWMQNDRKLTIAAYDDLHERLYPAFVSINSLLAEYFKIDLRELEKEKREMLAELGGKAL